MSATPLSPTSSRQRTSDMESIRDQALEKLEQRDMGDFPHHARKDSDVRPSADGIVADCCVFVKASKVSNIGVSPKACSLNLFTRFQPEFWEKCLLRIAEGGVIVHAT